MWVLAAHRVARAMGKAGHRRAWGQLLAVGALVVGIASWISDQAPASGEGSAAQGTRSLTVYSSLPLQGQRRPQGLAIVNGIRLALSEASGRAGLFSVRHVSLDDSTARAGGWTPVAVSVNARRAARDRSAIAYIGELTSAASEISIPILNEGRRARGEDAIPQISPANTWNGLTTDEPGADIGAPDKYYPTGVRSYLRLAPRATVEGGGLAALMAKRGCRRAALVAGRHPQARGITYGLGRFAPGHNIRLVWTGRLARPAPSYRGLARSIRMRRPDCIAYTGIRASGAKQLFRDLNRAMPRARLFGRAGIAEPSWDDPGFTGVPARVRRRTLVIIHPPAPAAFPPAGRAFFSRYVRRYGRRELDPYAIYGYEATRLVLDTIQRLGPSGSDRAAVREALFATRERESVLGRYSFDANGDTSLAAFGAYRPLADGSYRFVDVVRPQPR
jgi:branched-chain amino acid transport system substrate-binding protein